MEALTLIIGNKKYSSWSMRPWLFLQHHHIPFAEVRIPLFAANSRAALREYSPTGLVPVLQHGELTIWESLAILEYIAELYPQTRGWPADRRARALARAVSAEMHAGFINLRTNLTTNVIARYQWQECGEAVAADIARIEAMWAQCRHEHGNHGPWLFGEFSIADAMFAPVATRFRTYNVPLAATSRDYVETVHQLPAFKSWYDEARRETEVITENEYSHWQRITPSGISG
jgi:glutathione S-transferase